MQHYDEALRIYYEIKEDDTGRYVVITDADRKLNEVIIPETIDSAVVRVVARKAFLGCKGLRKVTLPSGIRSVGEWAFAFCDNLMQVDFYRAKTELGKGVFKNDLQLKEIRLNEGEESPDDADNGRSETAMMTARLLAAVPVLMDAEYLLDTEAAGKDEWLGKWDTRLEHILDLKDDEGYHLYVLCGEEDLHFDYDEYLEYNREKKSGLCMLRLVNDMGLDERVRDRLKTYLCEHTIGCDSEAAIRVLLKRHGDEREYYALMLDTGAINASNLEAVLNMMGDRHAGMKAYLIEECKAARDDFFDDLML